MGIMLPVGVLVMTLGPLIALGGTAGLAPWRNMRSAFGWSIVLLAWLQLLGGWLRGSKVMKEAGAVNRSFEDHAVILEALRTHDPDLAGEAIAAHLDHVYKTTVTAMKKKGV